MRFCVSGIVMAVLTIALMFPASPAYADFYKWVDENGIVWITNDPGKLPEEAQGQFEKVMDTENVPDAPPASEAVRPSTAESRTTPSAESYLERENRRDKEKNNLKKEISTIETDLGRAREALQRIPSSDIRGYWFVVDPATGKKVQASYKDPGAIWSNATWPEVPLEARIMASEERRRIESDITKMEGELNRVKEKLSALLRSP
jgi:hypothetical protein